MRRSKVFLLNLIIALFLTAGFSWWVLRYLDDYTLHGQTITVPDLTGYVIADIESLLQEKKLRYKIADTIYIAGAKKGVIIDQAPKPDAKVKKNRTIYLIVNAKLTPKVKLPNLVDLSLRQAITILETYGFIVGELEYKPDIALDAVIGQKINGRDVESGEMVTKGAKIDLVMGAGLSENLVPVPHLIGLSREDAITELKLSSLNAGGEKYDETVVTAIDSMEAKVWRQNPESGEALINLGGYIDMWFTKDELKRISDSAGSNTLSPIDL